MARKKKANRYFVFDKNGDIFTVYESPRESPKAVLAQWRKAFPASEGWRIERDRGRKLSVAHGFKNPAKKKPAFGKKGAAKLRALPTKDYRQKRTTFSRKEAIIAMRNPSLGSRISRFVVRAVKHDGGVMYFDGRHFKGDKKKAATYAGKAGEAVMEAIEEAHAATLKRGGVKYLDVVQA